MIDSRRAALLLLSIGVTASATAYADDGLRDRYVAASQQIGETMLDVIEDCAPDLDTSGIDFEYTERMVASVECVVETHIERFGRAETVALVEEVEAMADRTFSSLQEMATLQQDYPRLSDPAMLEINQDCGTVEASQDLPLSALMQDNMAKLAGCFSAP
ncbi:hypothetical protein [Halomonas denitrificans]|nr:hypothetical protein [Halomonas denitrificans]